MSDPYQHRVGTRLRNKWLIERLLGAGGMAAVYEGVNAIGRRVAIKILHPEVASDPEQRERFELEGRAVNQIQHPGVIEIVDIDTTEDGLPFLVMELLEGQTLQDLVDQGRPPTVEALLQLTDQLLDVLAAAHSKGIIHRDLKPDNLFVLPDGRLKVLDFGIARVRTETSQNRAPTQTGTIIGTAAFMSPEQIRGVRDLDARADLYSVGATLFRVLANRHVHLADGQFELLLKASSAPAPPLRSAAPQIPEPVALVVDRALVHERDQRYPDAISMQGDVRALLRNEPPPFAVAHLGTAPHSLSAANHAAAHGGTPTIVHGTTASFSQTSGPPSTMYGYSVSSAQSTAQPLGYAPAGDGKRKSPPIPLLVLGGVIMLSGFLFVVTMLRKATQSDPPELATPTETSSPEQPAPPETSTATAAATGTEPPPTPTPTTTPPTNTATPAATAANTTTPTPSPVLPSLPPAVTTATKSVTSSVGASNQKAKGKSKGKGKGKK